MAEDKTEIFHKADLSELPKSKAKKKRELLAGAKVKSKPSAKRQKDAAQPLSQRPKQLPLTNQENSRTVGLGRTKNHLSSLGNGRPRTLHSSKAKVSETVTTRKILGDLRSNVVANNNQLHHDLQRVLGKGANPSPTPQPRPTLHNPTTSNTSGTEMECSPAAKNNSPPSSPHLPNNPHLPLVEIACRLAQGLQVDVIFPHSCYLDNVKAELKKVLKQSNPHNYKELIRYFSDSQPALPPFIAQLQHPMLPGAGVEHQEASGLDAATMTSDPSSQATLEPPHSNPIPNKPHLNPAHSAASSSDLTTAPGNGALDTVALNLEVNTSALNINDQGTPRPKDLLDMMDSAAMTTQHATPTNWDSPSRPRLFPHKLY